MPLFIPQHFCLVSQRLCRQYLFIKLYPEKQIPHSSELLCCPRTWGQYYVIYWWPYVWTHLSSVHLHIFLCWTSRGRSQNRYFCSPAHLPLLKVKGPFTNSKHLSTCTFPLMNFKGPFTSSTLTSLHLHISQRWPVKGQFLQRTSIGPILASSFCPLRNLIHHIFFNFSLWPAHSFLPHHFSIHVNQTRSHVRWRLYVPPKHQITHYHTA